jgi:MOSC domain-containing protein YiiM
VGRPRQLRWRGRLVTSAIWKEPVTGAVVIEGVNLAGDDQADRRVHGGPDKAVYAYSVEDYQWWALRTGPLSPGTFGENLTTAGIDLTACHIGDRWHVGTAILEVAQPREPCFKLGIRMNDDQFPGAFASARRPGAYLRIIAAGAVAAGDQIEVAPAEQPAIRIGSLVEEDIDHEVLRQAVDDPRLTEGWRRSAARALARVSQGPQH